MCIFHETRGKMSLVFVLLFITFTRPSVCTILHVQEGEEAKLNFSYPCDITKITLQHSYRAPFYSSDISKPMPPRYELANHTKSEGDTPCSILLIIDPVLRSDVGTYILSVYNNSQLLPEYPRIGLRVAYPPGKASCESSSNYLDGAWIKLQCNAPLGNLAGQIACYQNGERLPPLGTPVENGGRLSQVILARIADHSVHCCSSTLYHTKTMQQCRDCGWDPIQNIALTDITDLSTSDPSTTVSPTQHSQLTKNFTLEGETPSSPPHMITDMATNKDVCSDSKKPVYVYALSFLILIFVVYSILIFVLKKNNKILKKKILEMKSNASVTNDTDCYERRTNDFQTMEIREDNGKTEIHTKYRSLPLV